MNSPGVLGAADKRMDDENPPYDVGDHRIIVISAPTNYIYAQREYVHLIFRIVWKCLWHAAIGVRSLKKTKKS